MSPFLRYSLKRSRWYLITFIFAVFLNFYLPRLVPGDPVSAIVSEMAGPGASTESLKRVYETFMNEFGLDKPIFVQFYDYIKLLLSGSLGTSFNQYPRPVNEIIAQALPWTLVLQLPAMLLGWTLGNIMGAIAAYRKGIFDKAILQSTLFLNSIPAYAVGILLLYIFGVNLGWFPVGGGYAINLFPGWNGEFIASALQHYFLPFISITLVMVGGQAIGMREMSIYELNADYVLYSRSLGIKKNKIIRYVFKNALLPQITGLATMIAMVVGGSLITEIVFSYPGLGYYLFGAIRQSDYPVVQGITLIITVGVLLANFIMDLTYGFIDPRVKSAQVEEEVN